MPRSPTSPTVDCRRPFLPKVGSPQVGVRWGVKGRGCRGWRREALLQIQPQAPWGSALAFLGGLPQAVEPVPEGRQRQARAGLPGGLGPVGRCAACSEGSSGECQPASGPKGLECFGPLPSPPQVPFILCYLFARLQWYLVIVSSVFNSCRFSKQ